MSSRSIALAMASLLGVAACSPEGTPARSTVRSRIVYGEASPEGTSDDAVLLLRTTVDGRELVCSATLVAANLVLTARHCIAHSVQGPFNCTVRGELVDNPDGAGQIGLDLPADGLEFYSGAVPRTVPVARGKSILSTLSSTICLNDLAFVVLDRSVPLPVLPLRTRGRARVGATATLVGYGLDELVSQTIDVRTGPRRRKTGLTITGVGPDSVADGVITVAPRTLVVDEPSGCLGDSGGPLLDGESGAIFGVYSLLAGVNCADPDVRNEFVHVPPFKALIDEAFRAAGATPAPEPRSDLDAGSPSDGTADARAEAGVSSESVTSAPAEDGCRIVSGGMRARSGPLSLYGEVFPATACALFVRRRRTAIGRRRQRRPSSGSSPIG